MTIDARILEVVRSLPKLQDQPNAPDLYDSFSRLNPEQEVHLTIKELAGLLEAISACVTSLASVRNAVVGATLDQRLFAAQASSEATLGMNRSLEALNSTMARIVSRLEN